MLEIQYRLISLSSRTLPSSKNSLSNIGFKYVLMEGLEIVLFAEYMTKTILFSNMLSIPVAIIS